jgi:hypothetical protein
VTSRPAAARHLCDLVRRIERAMAMLRRGDLSVTEAIRNREARVTEPQLA